MAPETPQVAAARPEWRTVEHNWSDTGIELQARQQPQAGTPAIEPQEAEGQ